MNEKEISELRRRVRRDRSNMKALYGCFVSETREIISTFRLPLGIMPENEANQYFAMMKKCLSGGHGKNLIDISFSTQQVTNGAEHKLLMDLRETELQDEDTLARFYQTIIEAVNMESSYLILIGADTYDVPLKQAEDSSETFRYLLCAVCPVKLSKSVIEYKAENREFHSSPVTQVTSNPVMGFLFPAFDDRSTNIYNALFYSKDSSDSHEDFLSAVFNVAPFVPADTQKQAFAAALSHALDDECHLDVVQAVHEELNNKLMVHTESRAPHPLTVTKSDIKNLLTGAGVSPEKAHKFEESFDESFGSGTEIPVKNIIDPKRFAVRTPDVDIRVNPDRSDLIETRVIGGVKYIMICADETVEVNGVAINIEDAN